MTETKTRIQDDLYQAVNGEWLKTAVIPDDKPTTGGFQTLADEVEKTLMADFENFSENPEEIKTKPMQETIKLYQLAKNFKQRDQQNEKPIVPLIKKIEDLPNLNTLEVEFRDWTLNSLPVPFDFGVDADMKNTKQNLVYAGAPSLILPDKTYYEPGNESAEALMKTYRQMSEKLLEMTGKSSDDAQKIVNQAIEFDALLVPHVKDSEQLADYPKLYNPKSMEEVKKYSQYINLADMADQLTGSKLHQIIVTEPDYFEALDQIINPDNFDLMKSWMIVKTINHFSTYLSEEFRQTSGIYSRALSGSKAAMNQTKSAYHLANRVFSEVVGNYYGEKYFGSDARDDVRVMVEKMIAVYKTRLQNNSWLSEKTKKQAILKLNKIEIKVGYPDQLDPVYQKLHTDDSKSLLENILNFNEVKIIDNLQKIDEPVNRKEWGMPANLVNAMYDPSRNDITFPAAILQAPFYSLKQSKSANFGGIGAVIAHEISHAFDNNGAKFDEYGNLKNWWTEHDYAYFEKLTQEMIDQFNGIPFAGGHVNGKLVVSENIADAGGLSCALETAENQTSPDLTAFFENWARVWCMKATEQYEQLLLKIDVHAPHELRANMQPKNLDDFYTTFDVKPGDGMYLAPEKRIHIW